MRCALHHPARHAHRRDKPLQRRDRAGVAGGAVHDRGVQFHNARGVGRRALARHVQPAGLQFLGHGRHDIERALPAREHVHAPIEQGGHMRFFALICAFSDRTGAAVQREGPSLSHGPLMARWLTLR